MRKDIQGGQPGFVIEQTGPNGWSVIGTGALIGIAMVIIALALFEMATWAGIALIIVAGGQSVYSICRGVALIIEARAKARLIAGPRAREDMKALGWEERGRRY